MQARDIMTSDVVTVGPDATVREIAALLAEKRISGVPVVDGAKHVIGVVSEADLLHRPEIGTEKRHSWWVTLLDDEAALAAEFVRQRGTKAADIMTTKVVSVVEGTSIQVIADLLDKHRIKRVIVVSQGKLAGIISRSDIVRALAHHKPSAAAPIRARAGSDAEIRTLLQERMQAEVWAHTPYVNTIVHDGIVELSGFVSSENQKRALHVLAETMPGVRAVHDQVEVFVPPVSAM